MRNLILLSVFLGSFSQVFGQQRLQEVLLVGLEDAQKILRAYIKPAGEATGFSQAEGWTFTAKPLRAGKFGFQLVVLGTIVPQENVKFDINSLGLQNVTLTPSSPRSSPTFLGGEDAATLIINSTGDSVKLFEGANIPDRILPFVAPQFSLGLFKNTEISVRFFPAIPIERVEAGIFGVAIKHDLKQWIPAIALADFSLSALVSYSRFNVQYGLDITNVPAERGQLATFKNDAFSVGVIASKRFTALHLFGGLRYDNSASKALLEKTYLVGSGLEQTLQDNPFEAEFSSSRLGLSVGGKLHLGPLYIGLSGTLSEYSSLGLAIGLSGRK